MATRVLILTTEPHGDTAAVLAAALHERGADADVVDALAATGSLARALASASPPRSGAGGRLLDAGYALGTRVAPARRAAARGLERIAARPLGELLAAHPAEAIVSTAPPVTCVLGHLRATGALATPTAATITELAGLQFSAHPGIDLHLLAYAGAVAEARAVAGPQARVEAAAGLVDPRFEQPPERTVAREQLGLSPRGSLVVVSGGTWGVGDLFAATDTALHYSANTVIVLTGRNEAVRERLQSVYGDDERVLVWGEAEDMVALLSAADALIHSSAGLAVLEAQLCDCRVISYGWPRGRVRASDRAYGRLGLAAVARSRPQLAHALVAALAAPPLQPQEREQLPAAADLVLELAAAPLQAAHAD